MLKKIYCPNCCKRLVEYSMDFAPNVLFSVKCECGYEWKSHEQKAKDKEMRICSRCGSAPYGPYLCVCDEESSRR